MYSKLGLVVGDANQLISKLSQENGIFQILHLQFCKSLKIKEASTSRNPFQTRHHQMIICANLWKRSSAFQSTAMKTTNWMTLNQTIRYLTNKNKIPRLYPHVRDWPTIAACAKKTTNTCMTNSQKNHSNLKARRMKMSTYKVVVAYMIFQIIRLVM